MIIKSPKYKQPLSTKNISATNRQAQTQLYKNNKFQRTASPRVFLSSSKSKPELIVRESVQNDWLKYIKDIQTKGQQIWQQTKVLNRKSEEQINNNSDRLQILPPSPFKANMFEAKQDVPQKEKYKTTLRQFISPSNKENYQTMEQFNRSNYQKQKTKKIGLKTTNSSFGLNLSLTRTAQTAQSVDQISRLKEQIVRLNKCIQQKDKAITQFVKKIELLQLKQQSYNKKITSFTHKNQQLRRQLLSIREQIQKQHQKTNIIAKQLKKVQSQNKRLLDQVGNQQSKKFLQIQLREKQRVIFDFQSQNKSLKVKISCIQFKFNSEKNSLLTKRDERIYKLMENNRKLEQQVRILRRKKNKSSMLLDISISDMEST